MVKKNDVSKEKLNQLIGLANEMEKIRHRRTDRTIFPRAKALVHGLSGKEIYAILVNLCDLDIRMFFASIELLYAVYRTDHKEIDEQWPHDTAKALDEIYLYPNYLKNFFEWQVPVAQWQKDAQDFLDLYRDFASKETPFDRNDPRAKALYAQYLESIERLYKLGYKVNQPVP